MEIVSTILIDWLCPIAWCVCGIFVAIKLCFAVCNTLKKESENTLHIHVTNDEMPDKIGDLFTDTFATVFSNMFRRN